jgi:predicted nucleotidyltransferase
MNASSSIGRLEPSSSQGPKSLEFYEQFSNHRAMLIKADGKDILSVRMHINSETQAERDVETITQAKEWEDLSP